MVESSLNITVVGMGLIGGSFAMALRSLNLGSIWAIDKNPEILENAVKSGIIDGGYTDGTEILPKSDIIIVALYPENALQFISRNLNNFRKGSIITDTCGIKKDLVTRIQSIIGDDLEFIGGHPLAGKAENGYKNADKNLFAGTNYIITPTHKNKRKNIDKLQWLVKSIGCNRIVEMTVDMHDEIIAYTSQLPHLIAVSLMNIYMDEENLTGLIGGSFKDASRVAVLNADLWRELLISNKTNIVSLVECFENKVRELKNAIINEDESFLMKSFEIAFKRRKEISP